MNCQYIDPIWIHRFPLTIDTVLDYFYTSPFYDSDCNNHVLRTQGVSIDNLRDMIGTQYDVDRVLSAPPTLFVIKKQHRSTPSTVQNMEVFYCIDGAIYQAPLLLELLESRMCKASNHLLRALRTLHSNISCGTDGNHTFAWHDDIEQHDHVRSKQDSDKVVKKEFLGYAAALNDVKQNRDLL